MLNQNFKRYFPSKCSITNTFQCSTVTLIEDMNIRNSKVTLKPNQMHLTKGIRIRRAADVKCQSMNLQQSKQSPWNNKCQESFLHQQCVCAHSECRPVSVWVLKSIPQSKRNPSTLEPECFSSPKPSTRKCLVLLSSCSKLFKVWMCLKVHLGMWGWKCMCTKDYETAYNRFLHVLIKRN